MLRKKSSGNGWNILSQCSLTQRIYYLEICVISLHSHIIWIFGSSCSQALKKLSCSMRGSKIIIGCHLPAEWVVLCVLMGQLHPSALFPPLVPQPLRSVSDDDQLGFCQRKVSLWISQRSPHFRVFAATAPAFAAVTDIHLPTTSTVGKKTRLLLDILEWMFPLKTMSFGMPGWFGIFPCSLGQTTHLGTKASWTTPRATRAWNVGRLGGLLCGELLGGKESGFAFGTACSTHIAWIFALLSKGFEVLLTHKKRWNWKAESLRTSQVMGTQQVTIAVYQTIFNKTIHVISCNNCCDLPTLPLSTFFFPPVWSRWPVRTAAGSPRSCVASGTARPFGRHASTRRLGVRDAVKGKHQLLNLSLFWLALTENDLKR